MNSTNVTKGRAALLALALLPLLGAWGCKGTVEKDADGKVTSVGVKTDPEVTEKVEEAGADLKEGAQKAGEAIQEGASKAGHAVEKGAKAIQMSAVDTALAARIKAKLLADPEVKGLDITVEANAGRVVLKGKAESRDQKQEAGKLARNTDGVQDVRNKIHVSGGG